MAKIGSETRPVYVGPNGQAAPCSVDLHDISVENKGDHDVIAIVTIDNVPYEIKNFQQGGGGGAFVVTFKDWDGRVLKTEAVLKGGNATAPSQPTPPEGHTWKGWDKAFTNVQSDLIVTATYNVQTFTVTFRQYKDGTYTTLKTQIVEYGKDATAPDKPDVTGYNTSDWDKSYKNIKANTTVTCTLTKKVFTITFVNNGGTVLEAKSWEYNSTPSYSKEDPTPENPDEGKRYTFTGWSPTIVPVTENKTYTAQYSSTVITYTVTFKLNGGNIGGVTDDVVVTNVAHGTKFSSVRTRVTNPSKTSTVQYDYTFGGWDKADTLEIKSDTTTTAKWTPVERYYTITFKNYNASSAGAGTTLETKSVKYGTVPTYTGTKPSVESPVEGKTYTWNSSDGWTPAIVAVTGNATYVAKYAEGYQQVKVTFALDGGNIGGSTADVVRTVSYGTPLSDVTKPSNPSKSGYNFTDWGSPVPATAINASNQVIADCTITAQYVEINYYAVKFFYKLGADGTPVKIGETQRVKEGGAATEPTRPTITGWTAGNWDKDFSYITADTDVTCTYAVNRHTLSIVRRNTTGGTAPTEVETTVIGGGTKNFGEVVTPTASVNSDYVNKLDFVNFKDSAGNVITSVTMPDSDVAIYADFIPKYKVSFFARAKVQNMYTVTFQDWDGSTISSKLVTKGTSYDAISKPDDPTRVGHKFTGWSEPDPSTSLDADRKVIGNCVITAQYERERLLVTEDKADDFIFSDGSYIRYTDN